MKTQVLSFIVLALTLTGCGSDKSALKFTDGVKKVINEVQVKPVQPTDEKDLAFLSLQKNLVQTSCLKCHNATQTRHSNLTSKQVFTEKLDDIIYRVTGAFDVGDGFMPPKGERVKPEVIKELKAWRSDAQFANLQKSLFEPSCLKCHGPNQTRHSDLTSKAVVIEKYDNILYKMTKAFDESNKPMPPVGKGNRVSPELIKALEAWKANL